MAMNLWAPFSAFTALEQEMHSLQDRLGARPWVEGFGWKPDTDIFREGDALVIQAELPGVDPDESLTIEVEGNVLLIKGKKATVSEIHEPNQYVSERRFGSFQRSVMLPDGVDPSSVTAVYANGVLTVTVPLPDQPSAEPKSVQVNIEVRP